MVGDALLKDPKYGGKDPRDLFRELYEKDMELEKLRQEKELRDKQAKEELERLRKNTVFRIKRPSGPSEDEKARMKALKLLQDDAKNVDNLA